MDNIILERQEGIQLSIPEIATIVGCGGTGFWTALFLAMQGTKHLILIDDDELELSNLNRLPFSPNDIRLSGDKIDRVAEFLDRIRPHTIIEKQYLKILSEDNCDILRGVVFCCTDNLASQQLVCAYCRKNRLQYQRVGYDGTIVNVSRAFPLSFKENLTNGYTITPSWVVPAVLAAALGVFSITKKEIMVMDEIEKIGIKDTIYVPQAIREVIAEKEIAIHEDNGELGWCENCDRISPENEDYGYCPECDKYERGKEEGYESGYDTGYAEGLVAGEENALKEKGEGK